MAPALRGRVSEFSSKVTLYEPVLPVKMEDLSPAKRAAKRVKVEDIAGKASDGGVPATPASSRKRVKLEELSPAASSSKRGTAAAKVEAGEDLKPVRASPSKAFKFVEKLDKAHPAPKNWEDTYATIQAQRERLVAPVDTMGCEQGGLERDEVRPNEIDQRLSILVSLMLSSQTKDPVTHQAVKNLRTQLPGGLTLSSLLGATVTEIDAAICKVGFHNTKAINLKKMAERLRDEHDGDVPSDLKQLLALNGVGPKMSLLYLQAIGINAGIGVDVHVHRITNRLRWHKPESKTPEQTRLNLESWLPKELHPKINLMLVGFGQTICTPVNPRCDLCDLGRKCPSYRMPTPKRAKGGKDITSSSASVKVEVEGKVPERLEQGQTPVAARGANLDW